MKQFIVALVAMIGIGAHADATGPAWVCELDGTLSGKSIGIVLDITDSDQHRIVRHQPLCIVVRDRLPRKSFDIFRRRRD